MRFVCTGVLFRENFGDDDLDKHLHERRLHRVEFFVVARRRVRLFHGRALYLGVFFSSAVARSRSSPLLIKRRTTDAAIRFGSSGLLQAGQ